MSHLAEGTQPSENIDPHLYLQAKASTHRKGSGGAGGPHVSQCSGTGMGMLTTPPNCPNMLPVHALVLRAKGKGCARPGQGSPEEQGHEVQVVLDQLRIPWPQNPRVMPWEHGSRKDLSTCSTASV